MKLSKKLLALCLVGTMVVMPLVGCGGSSDVSTETTQAATQSGAMVSDSDWTALQTAYGSMVDVYNAVKGAYESGAVEQSEQTTTLINTAAGLINQMGNVERGSLSEKDASDLAQAMLDTVTGLQLIAESLQL